MSRLARLAGAGALAALFVGSGAYWLTGVTKTEPLSKPCVEYPSQSALILDPCDGVKKNLKRREDIQRGVAQNS